MSRRLRKSSARSEDKDSSGKRLVKDGAASDDMPEAALFSLIFRAFAVDIGGYMKLKRVVGIIVKILVILVAVLVLFTLGTFIYHRVKTKGELELLKEKGYYNPVSVGDYSLNAAKFGNEEGKHTIVSLAGLGMGNYSVVERRMTACLESDNLVVFVDRAGYGLSDDTDNEMTLEYIVEDYRRALKSAGLEAPYILMAHSVGGVYANYWSSKYPEEIEAVVFVDGSQLSESAYDDRECYSVSFGDRALAFLAKLGFERYFLRDDSYLLPDVFSEEEQRLADALELMTVDSVAPVSESGLIAKNGKDAWDGIVTNDVPKLYICASWGARTKEEIIENNKWVNRQIEKNHLDVSIRPTDYEDTDETLQKLLNALEDARQDIIYPYAEKMGACEVVLLPGDHAIYEQRPEECGKVVKDFIDGLDA